MDVYAGSRFPDHHGHCCWPLGLHGMGDQMNRQQKFEQAYAEANGMPVETFEAHRMGDTYRLPGIAKCWRFWNMALDSAPLDRVVGDQLPAIGSKVLIHLGSSDAWVEQTVAGYYAWGDLGENQSLHRLFVRVIDADGYLNARLLKDVRIESAGLRVAE